MTTPDEAATAVMAEDAWSAAESLTLGESFSRLATRVVLVREPGVAALPRIRSSRDVYRQFGEMSRLDRECFVALLLDGKHRVTGFHIVSIGCLQGTPVHPREVFKAAIVSNAAAIIVLHNHPSGDPTPSREDREVTDRLKASGELLGIPLLDHVVIAADGYWSLVERNATT